MQITLVSENELVGTADGFFVFRNLYETENGNKVSIPISKPIPVDFDFFFLPGDRHLSKAQLLEKYKLPQKNNS